MKMKLETRSMKTMQLQGRQGDVLCTVTTRKPPTDAVEVPREGGRVILAHGEVTGHAHAIPHGGARLLTVKSDPRAGRPVVGRGGSASNDSALAPERWLVLDGGRPSLEHEDHDHFGLPAGETIGVTIQREYAPGAIVNVMD